MKQIPAPIVNRYNFAWLHGINNKKKLKIHLIEPQTIAQSESKLSEREREKFRRFLVRLRSD